MSTKELYVIPRNESRQAQLEALAIGESVTISKRIEMEYGCPPGTIGNHSERLRGIMDQQVNRARRKRREYRYTVENGSFLTRSGAIILNVVATRIE